MKKWMTVCMAILCLFLTGCAMQTDKNAISDELGVDLSSGKQISYSEGHGGFHGDGMTYVVLKFSNDTALEQIRENEAWNEFPLDDTVTALVYGLSDTTDGTMYSVGPFITDEQGAACIPEIQNGYYYLLDRHSEKGETEILERASFNFTLGIYDTDTDILYYCKFDT